RNASASIAILFPELLARIFEFLVLAQPPSRQKWTRRAILGWIPLTTHTSHHWRQVALAHPVLWRRISFDIGSIWAREMVERAKAVPLTLTW
ncbi:hypothetical protein BV25DRAFT_1788142, partial [Artomyces pyxidatus]